MKRGRPTAPRPKRSRIFAAISEEDRRGIEAVAANHRVDLSTLMRWWVSEAIRGVWVPEHLKNHDFR